MVPKPPRPVLNRRHPAAKGLESAVLFWQWGQSPASAGGAGASSTHGAELVSGMPLTWWSQDGATSASAFTEMGALGQGLKQDSVRPAGIELPGSAVVAPIADKFAATKPWTIAVWCRMDVTGVAGGWAAAYLAGTAGDYDAKTSINAIRFDESGSKWGIQRYDENQGGSSTLHQSGTMSTALAVHFVVATYDGGTTSLYVDGAYVAGGSSALSIGYVQDYFVVGNYWASVYRMPHRYNWFGHIYSASLWSRCLSSAAIADLYADPWALYRPRYLQVRSNATAQTFAPWLPAILHRRVAR